MLGRERRGEREDDRTREKCSLLVPTMDGGGAVITESGSENTSQVETGN